MISRGGGTTLSIQGHPLGACLSDIRAPDTGRENDNKRSKCEISLRAIDCLQKKQVYRVFERSSASFTSETVRQRKRVGTTL